jgi:hypothetical protein
LNLESLDHYGNADSSSRHSQLIWDPVAEHISTFTVDLGSRGRRQNLLLLLE